MGYTFYQYLAFIQPDSDAEPGKLKHYLESFYAGGVRPPQIILTDKLITVAFDSYNFRIHYSDEPHVAVEAAELAEDSDADWSEKHFDKEKLKSSSKRFELSGDPDYDMDYFNDSLYIVEIIEKFNGVIVFNIS
ncbi:MAG: hypothetical protein DI535_25700 [Citrobacter freundii]|nr:MAG: hypothetical protein DI535_25700 [Citrobacter freundii]